MMITLNSGYQMPALAYGTSSLFGQELQTGLELALQAGFRHIDTASIYRNESEIGDFLTQLTYERSDLFITTKAWSSQFQNIRQACEDSLSRLKTEYIDLYLLHWPVTLKASPPGELPEISRSDQAKERLERYPLHLVWKQMEDLVRAGLVRSIGVSNWNEVLLNDMLAYAEIPPAVNQIESHPYYKEKDLVKFCLDEGVAIVCYRVLFKPNEESRHFGKPSASENELIDRLADKYGKSKAEILMEWNFKRGCGGIARSVNEERVEENFESESIEIEEEDFEMINEMEEVNRFEVTTNLFGINIV